MHAFGLGRELCYEFLMKQCVIANLNAGRTFMRIDRYYTSGNNNKYSFCRATKTTQGQR